MQIHHKSVPRLKTLNAITATTVAVVIAASVAHCGFADEKNVVPTMPVAESEAQPAKTQVEKDIDRSLERYQVFVDDDDQALKPVSVLTWNNPLAGGVGKFRTVVLVKDGQPKSVCCIWGSSSNRLYHEFGSLTRSKLRGEIDGRPSWEFAASGKRFREIPDSDPPAADRRRRLLQMKKLIRRFGAVETKSRKGEATREQLRLLPTPLYRYEKESVQILDGAVFSYVHTTDPEALVVIEAVRSGDTMRWEYTFVRRTTLPVIGQLDDATVWSTTEAGYRTFNQIRYN